jgi:hypothetical protein
VCPPTPRRTRNARTPHAGAGKTTLLRHLLSNQAGQRTAVLVNDMAALNIDERLVADKVAQASGQQLVSLSNGCICCTIQEDLVRELQALAAAPQVCRAPVVVVRLARGRTCHLHRHGSMSACAGA